MTFVRLNKHLNQYHIFIIKLFIWIIYWIHFVRDEKWKLEIIFNQVYHLTLYLLSLFFFAIITLIIFLFSVLMLCYYMFWYNVISLILHFLCMKGNFERVIDYRQKSKFNSFKLIRYNMDLYSSLIKKIIWIFIFSAFNIYILILGLIVSLNNFYEIK